MVQQVDARADQDYQEAILVYVSRTFALTIPQLPRGLREAVTTAYLLCRIADTIEDEPSLGAPDKQRFLRRFSSVVSGAADADQLAGELTSRLSNRTSEHERDLVAHLARVVRSAHRLQGSEQAAIQRCIEIMCTGMHYFQSNANTRGLNRLVDLDSYCYHVAGVVGEMLTELFCARSPEVQGRAAALRHLSPSFGQGLQMTNILKDMWEDRSRGACWLPLEVFERRGINLDQLLNRRHEQAFRDSMQELIGIAHGHLRNALEFTLLIPAEESGIRRFCLWSIGLAVLTLREIHNNPHFMSGAQVKVSHRAVWMVTTVCKLCVQSDRALTQLFNWAARGLPLVEQTSAGGAETLRVPLLLEQESNASSLLHS